MRYACLACLTCQRNARVSLLLSPDLPDRYVSTTRMDTKYHQWATPPPVIGVAHTRNPVFELKDLQSIITRKKEPSGNNRRKEIRPGWPYSAFHGRRKKVRNAHEGFSSSIVAPFYDIPVWRLPFYKEGVRPREIEQDGSSLGDWDEGLKRANLTAA